MSKRKILSEKEIEYYASLSDSEWSDISVGESDDFIPGSESDKRPKHSPGCNPKSILQKGEVFWQDILTKVVSIVKFLSARGLPFRCNVLRDYVRRSNEQELKTEHRFLMLKSLSETRWCARADVLRARYKS
ncbi:hypothetical protein TNCV_378731 [Trichonephila clavipes]|nr:hypothetical protein TNCV_378731 [Trichonephila clavipes]